MHKYATHDLDRQHKAKSIILAMEGKGVRLSKPLTFVIAPPDYLTLFTTSFFIRNLLTAFLQGCPGTCWLSERATRVKKVNHLSQGKEGLTTGVANKDAPGISMAIRAEGYDVTRTGANAPHAPKVKPTKHHWAVAMTTLAFQRYNRLFTKNNIHKT